MLNLCLNKTVFLITKDYFMTQTVFVKPKDAFVVIVGGQAVTFA